MGTTQSAMTIGTFVLDYGPMMGGLIAFVVSTIVLWTKAKAKFENDISINKSGIKHNYEDIQKVDLIVRDHDKDIAIMKDNIIGIHESSKEHKKSVGRIDDKLDQLLMNQRKG